MRDGGLLSFLRVFGDPPLVVVTAVEQTGASGLGAVESSIDNGAYSASAKTVPDGLHTICGRAHDGVGNEAVDCELVRVDDHAPTVTVSRSAGSPAPNAPWLKDGVVVTVGEYDDGSGTGSPPDNRPVSYVIDDRPPVACRASCKIDVEGDGDHHVVVVARDAVGNIYNVVNDDVLHIPIDNTAPDLRVELVPSRSTGHNKRYRTGAVLRATATDATSGLSSLTYRLRSGETPQPLNGHVVLPEGTSDDICVEATDVAGNVSRWGCNGAARTVVRIDRTNPSVTISSPTAPAHGWFGAPVTLGVAATDGGTEPSGFGPVAHAIDAGRCRDVGLTESANETTGAGLCISVDGAPFQPVAPTTDVMVADGTHRVHAFALDVAGNRSDMVEQVIHVDRTAPIVTLRTLPPATARAGWFRQVPLVVLSATDGPQGSGVQRLLYGIDAPPTTPYTGPFAVPSNVHNVNWQVEDIRNTRTGTAQVKVDITPPKPTATSPDPAIWSRLLQPTVKLRYDILDDLSGPVRIGVIVYDALGNVVRRIDGGTVTTTPGATTSGFVNWDGKGGTLTTLVPLGVFYYRVSAIDEAGNTAMSGESKPVTISLLAICPPSIRIRIDLSGSPAPPSPAPTCI